MMSMSIDGISSMSARSSTPITEMFPSLYSIAEIRISESNNSAEFSGTSDVTTISKSGTNSYHGGLFENLQNTALQARNTFSATVPTVRLNNYGAYVGGPVRLGKLYNGQDKTFFFGSYEGLRLPKQTVLVQSVPSLALRSGDLSASEGRQRPDNRAAVSGEHHSDVADFSPFPERTQVPVSASQRGLLQPERQQLRPELRHANPERAGRSAPGPHHQFHAVCLCAIHLQEEKRHERAQRIGARSAPLRAPSRIPQ